ncbi:MAG: hypothetical protein E6Q97_13110 [Desulfurellales bacterium]|nr:MAG: hypothetical protein E6Q97_13110 [Desulfurellales bacterium]
MMRIYLALATFAAVGIFAFGFMKHHDRKVERRVVVKIEKKTDARVKKAVAAQKRANAPGAVDRVRSRYCADCE